MAGKNRGCVSVHIFHPIFNQIQEFWGLPTYIPKETDNAPFNYKL